MCTVKMKGGKGQRKRIYFYLFLNNKKKTLGGDNANFYTTYMHATYNITKSQAMLCFPKYNIEKRGSATKEPPKQEDVIPT